MNEYEVAVLYHPDLEVDLSKAEAKVQKIITGEAGKITKVDNWGKRKLAYPIKKQDHAIYVIYTAQIAAADVNKAEATLNITDEVIRYLIVRPDLKALAKAEAMRADKAEKAAKAAARGDTIKEESEEE